MGLVDSADLPSCCGGGGCILRGSSALHHPHQVLAGHFLCPQPADGLLSFRLAHVEVFRWFSPVMHCGAWQAQGQAGSLQLCAGVGHQVAHAHSPHRSCGVVHMEHSGGFLLPRRCPPAVHSCSWCCIPWFWRCLLPGHCFRCWPLTSGLVSGSWICSGARPGVGLPAVHRPSVRLRSFGAGPFPGWDVRSLGPGT